MTGNRLISTHRCPGSEFYPLSAALSSRGSIRTSKITLAPKYKLRTQTHSKYWKPPECGISPVLCGLLTLTIYRNHPSHASSANDPHNTKLVTAKANGNSTRFFPSVCNGRVWVAPRFGLSTIRQGDWYLRVLMANALED